MLIQGDCVEVMKGMAADSVDAIVCDPPYGLSFMGKEFDTLGEGAKQQEWHAQWLREAYRVLRSGGVVKAFGGTRTFHRLAAAMEECGFDCISLEAWSYASGFPKSHDVQKALVKAGKAKEAAKWAGWGTALKPAWEPVCVGYKP